MKRIIFLILAVVLVGFAAIARAGRDEGVAAYNRGDYTSQRLICLAPAFQFRTNGTFRMKWERTHYQPQIQAGREYFQDGVGP